MNKPLVIIRNPVVLSMSVICPPPTCTVTKQEYEFMFREESTFLTTRPLALYECFGGSLLLRKIQLLIFQVGA